MNDSLKPAPEGEAPGPFGYSSSMRRHDRSGFSLVEVSAAIGILAFAFVAVLGLLSTGLGNFRDAMDRTVTAQVAARVITEAQQSEFGALVGDDRSSARPDDFITLRYFDEQGDEIVPAKDDGLSSEERDRVVYYAGTRVRPSAEVPRDAADSASSLAQVTVEVAHYAGREPLTTESAATGSRVLKTPAGTPVFTYSALIARIQ